MRRSLRCESVASASRTLAGERLLQAVQHRKPERQACGISLPLASPKQQGIARLLETQGWRHSTQAKRFVFHRHVVGDEGVFYPFQVWPVEIQIFLALRVLILPERQRLRVGVSAEPSRR